MTERRRKNPFARKRDALGRFLPGPRRDARGRILPAAPPPVYRPPARDEFGRFRPPMVKVGETPRAVLPPHRDERGHFAVHPITQAARDLHAVTVAVGARGAPAPMGFISVDDFVDMADEYGLTEGEIWDLYEEAVG